MAGIFKSYDIRGTVPDQLNTGVAYRIGKAAVEFFGKGPIAVGRDMRLSSPSLLAAVLSGLTDAGADAVDLGFCSTPMTYFAAGEYGYHGVLMVTASHNPAEYNGFKLTNKGAWPVSYETGLAELEKLVQEDRPPAGGKRGRLASREVFDDWRQHVRRFARNVRKMKVAIDCGNGVMGAFVDRLLEGLPIEVVPLYFEPDGTFPHHEANPLRPENLADLQQAVVRERADLGLAFDGDGDRLFFVDETGTVVPTDLMTGLMAQWVLRQHPGAKILYDVRSSKILAELIAAAGGTPGVCRVGHSHMKRMMRQLDAVFAGELSGHYYFKHSHFSDSGEVAMMTALTLLSALEGPVSRHVGALKKYHHTGEINFEVEDKEAVFQRVEKYYAQAPGVKRLYRLDGLSLEFEDWWFNLRPSNTEPVVRLNLESLTSAAQMEEKKAEVLRLITS